MSTDDGLHGGPRPPSAGSAAKGRGFRLPYWLQRLLQTLPLAFLIVAINFFLLRLAPGDLADIIAGESGFATQDVVAELRRSFGTDKPVLQQFAAYLGRVLTFDLGWSFRNGQSVASLILERLGGTALLMVTSLVLAVLFGSLLGVVSGLTRLRVLDSALSTLSTLGFAMPLFWFGLVLIVVFSLYLGWFPSSGISTIGGTQTGLALWMDIAAHTVLPAVCLAFYYMAVYARVMRASVIEIAAQDFIRTARAKGAGRLRTVVHHILPNSLLALITLTGLQFGALFSGSITVEAVFGWPGLGQLALSAVQMRDLNLLLGILFVSSLFVLIVNVITDLSYALIDPRVDVGS